ncbi:hypothetical protein SLEP1_g54676 [Rubroshorea leprosula]|uniref:Uncharacterized protein n=1 Tax=Rubroshorea leprosula TaxID=152421 RepID=A0AAV5MFP2_9ROSI|nr:hypothetical protein SLEP1_g54676 [Rubroshorea leprosula]
MAGIFAELRGSWRKLPSLIASHHRQSYTSMPPCTPAPLLPALLRPPAPPSSAPSPPPLLQPSIPLLLHRACAPVLLHPSALLRLLHSAPPILRLYTPACYSPVLASPTEKKQRIPDKIGIISACWR